MATPFEEATLRAQTVRQLTARIEKLGLKPGDILGTEVKLAAELGLAVRTVREATSALKSIGMLSSRRRVGLIVTEPDPIQNLAAILPLYGRSANNIGELRRLRYVIEIGALELAVDNITDAQLATMKELADQIMDLWSEKQWLEADRCDARFHALILEATDSTLISSLHSVIALFFSRKAELADTEQGIRRKQSMNHHGICEAFRLRDIDKLRSILTVHLGSQMQDEVFGPWK